MFESRGLTDDERILLRGVFGSELDLDRIRVHDNHWTSSIPGVGAFVVGNNIQLSGKYIGDQTILIHEAAHVWQFQGAWGWRYLFNALKDHVKRALVSGHDPYDFSGVAGRVPWDQWSAEQQAQWVGDNESLPGPEIRFPASP